MNQELGRNEPCHCGSGKKYKRCHGVSAAPKLTPPKLPAVAADGSTPNPMMPGGIDPSKLDPDMMRQFSQLLQRLPKGQLQRLQGIMQRAMSGQDVTREASEFEKTLPVELQSLMISFAGQMGQMGAAGAEVEVPSETSGMSEEQAREIVAAAAAEGRIEKDEAEKLLTDSAQTSEKKKGLSKLWSGLTGKNPSST
ncbi:SEC-C domain-containing protein [Bdellovibrionota bacterium FG-1]